MHAGDSLHTIRIRWSSGSSGEWGKPGTCFEEVALSNNNPKNIGCFRILMHTSHTDHLISSWERFASPVDFLNDLVDIISSQLRWLSPFTRTDQEIRRQSGRYSPIARPPGVHVAELFSAHRLFFVIYPTLSSLWLIQLYSVTAYGGGIPWPTSSNTLHNLRLISINTICTRSQNVLKTEPIGEPGKAPDFRPSVISVKYSFPNLVSNVKGFTGLLFLFPFLEGRGKHSLKSSVSLQKPADANKPNRPHSPLLPHRAHQHNDKLSAPSWYCQDDYDHHQWAYWNKKHFFKKFKISLDDLWSRLGTMVCLSSKSCWSIFLIRGVTTIFPMLATMRSVECATWQCICEVLNCANTTVDELIWTNDK